MIKLMLKARKQEFTDKLGRKWRWSEAEKKYKYVSKGTRKVKQESSDDRTSKMIMAIKIGASVSDLAKELGLSKVRVRRILGNELKAGRITKEHYGRKEGKKKIDLKEVFKYETRHLNGEKLQKLEKRNPVDQPYKNTGIIIGRSNITKLPDENYISEDIMKGLRDHQSDFINLAMDTFKNGEKSIINSDGTGAGKTVQQIGLAETYLERNRKAKILIVTENDRIIANAFAKDAKRMRVKMTPIKKAGEMVEPGIYITAYKDLKSLQGDFKDVSFSIFDEAHNLKNEQSGKTKLGLDLIGKCKNSSIFSATPVDKPGHLAYICKAFNLDFKKVMKYLGYKKRFGQWWTNQSYEQIALKFDSVFKEFTEKGLMCKREVPLDGLLIHAETVELTPDYKLRYDEAVKKMNRLLEMSDPKEKGLLKAQWLMKIRAILEESKLESAMTKIEESIKSGKQVVLFASRVNDSILKDIKKNNYTKLASGTLNELAARLKKLGIDFAEVYGGKKDSAEDIKAFQDGKKKVLITTPQSGGTGISLDDIEGDKPRVAIIMTPPFSAVDFIQMPGRVHRLTTKSKSEIIMLNTNTDVEEWNKNIIANKLVTLGASVKGDYAALSVKDIELAENMSPDKAREFFQEKKKKLNQIPVTSEHKFNLNMFKLVNEVIKSLGDKLRRFYC